MLPLPSQFSDRNSLVYWSSKTFNHGLNHNHQFCDFNISSVFGNWVMLNLCTFGKLAICIISFIKKSSYENLLTVDHFRGKILSTCARNSKNNLLNTQSIDNLFVKVFDIVSFPSRWKEGWAFVTCLRYCPWHVTEHCTWLSIGGFRPTKK